MSKEIERSEAFAKELSSIYGETLVSVVLYGSAARGEYREGISDLNIMMIHREMNPSVLRKGSALARRWVKAGNQPPLMFGESEWKGSADVFPIEFGDMRDAHRVLHGSDPFEGLKIDPEHLRLQCEHELRSKLIQLREYYLLSADEPEELGNLFVRSLPTFLTLFRTALRLAGHTVSRDSREVIAATAAEIGFDPDAFVRVLTAREKGEKFTPKAEDPVAIGYLTGVSRTSEWLDRHDRATESA